MSKPFQLTVGVSNDPDAAPPTLKDLLDAALSQADDLMQQVLRELKSSQKRARGPSQNVISHPDADGTLERLDAARAEVAQLFHSRLAEGVMHAGKNPSAKLSFNDLGLFDDQDLSESVEIARAHMEIARAVDDVAPALDALVCTMMGWRTLQDDINPLRAEVFTRALRETLAEHIEDSTLREAIIVPAAGFMGVRMNTMYRALTDWLRSFGIEPAMPEGARMIGPDGSPAAAVSRSVAKTMLTLDKLRNLLMGDFDAKAKAALRSGGDFGLTVPASYETLEQLKQVDAVVQRLEQRSREEKAKPAATAAAAAPDMLADSVAGLATGALSAPQGALDIAVDDAPARKTLGKELGEEVVRLMFDNLANDGRLLPALKMRLKTLQPHVRSLARVDSRFFSDKRHPARQYMDRITQRSLAYQSESESGWARFQSSVDETLRELASREAGADVFTDLLAMLEERWTQMDEGALARRAEAAQALAHAEQRNLLAQRLAQGIEESMNDRDVAPTVADFLRGSWSLVIAESRLKNAGDSSDPSGYEALVEELLWSVDFRRARRNPNRLVSMIPNLVLTLRAGLRTIDYPPELTTRFFERLIALHDAVLGERRAAVRQAMSAEAVAAARAARAAAKAADQAGAPDLLHADEVWLANHEANGSGFIGAESVLAPEMDAQAQRMEEARQDAIEILQDPQRASDLGMGSWIELRTEGHWVRAQLTWASPHGSLFMFTAASGAAHSMSKRMMERLMAEGAMRIVSEGQLVDQALDQVADAALRNSLQAD